MAITSLLHNYCFIVLYSNLSIAMDGAVSGSAAMLAATMGTPLDITSRTPQHNTTVSRINHTSQTGDGCTDEAAQENLNKSLQVTEHVEYYMMGVLV